MNEPKKVKGEGNYEAAEKYNESQQEFIKSGKVKEVAGQAEPKSPAEAEAMKRAEKIGRSHAKGEDPAVKRTPTGDGKKG